MEEVPGCDSATQIERCRLTVSNRRIAGLARVEPVQTRGLSDHPVFGFPPTTSTYVTYGNWPASCRIEPQKEQIMDNLSWFDSYRGPKRIIVEPGQATCWIRFRVAQGRGRTARKELYAYGPNLTRALAEARQVYESIPNRLPDSNALNDRSRKSPH